MNRVHEVDLGTPVSKSGAGVDFEALVEGVEAPREYICFATTSGRGGWCRSSLQGLLEVVDLLILGRHVSAGFLEQVFECLAFMVEVDGSGGFSAQLLLALGEGSELRL